MALAVAVPNVAGEAYAPLLLLLLAVARGCPLQVARFLQPKGLVFRVGFRVSTKRSAVGFLPPCRAPKPAASSCLSRRNTGWRYRLHIFRAGQWFSLLSWAAQIARVC